MTFELKAVDIFGGVLKVRLKNDSTFSLAKKWQKLVKHFNELCKYMYTGS